ncbi:MAG: hypothetical protein AN485_23890, partial [Anabaena sp. MDT14b]
VPVSVHAAGWAAVARAVVGGGAPLRDASCAIRTDPAHAQVHPLTPHAALPSLQSPNARSQRASGAGRRRALL